jgi:hypothetical protein
MMNVRNARVFIFPLLKNSFEEWQSFTSRDQLTLIAFGLGLLLSFSFLPGQAGAMNTSNKHQRDGNM